MCGETRAECVVGLFRTAPNSRIRNVNSNSLINIERSSMWVVWPLCGWEPKCRECSLADARRAMTFIFLMTPSSEFQALSIPTTAQFAFNQKLTEPNNILL
jgi:hypothetical protein